MDHYAILGVSKTASDAEIKATFNSGVMVLNLDKIRKAGDLAIIQNEMKNQFVLTDQVWAWRACV